MNPNNNWTTPILNQNKFEPVNPNQNKSFNFSGKELLPRNSFEIKAVEPNSMQNNQNNCTPQPNLNNMKVKNNNINDNNMFNNQSNMSFMNNMNNKGMNNMNNNVKNIQGNFPNNYGNVLNVNKINNMIINNNQNKILNNQNNYMNNQGIVQMNINGNNNDMNAFNNMNLMNNMKNNVNVVVNNNINILINNVDNNVNNNMNNNMNMPNNMNMMNNMNNKMNIPNNNINNMNNNMNMPNNMNMMNNMNNKMNITNNNINNMNNNMNTPNNINMMNNMNNNMNMPNNMNMMNNMNNNMNLINNKMNNNNNIAINKNMNITNNNNNAMNYSMIAMNANMGINNNGNTLNYNMNNQYNKMAQNMNIAQNIGMNNPMAKSANINMNNKMKNNQNNMNVNNMKYNPMNNVQNNNVMNNIPNNMNNQNYMNIHNNMNIQQNMGINNGNMQMNNYQMNNNLMANQNNNFNRNINNNMNNNMGYQFMTNLKDFKLDFSGFKTFKEKPVNYNDIILNKKAEAFSTEINNITNKLNSIFCQDELSKIMDEKTLLIFFREKEEELIKYVDDNFGGEEFLKKFTIDEIINIFNENPIINHISQLVNAKINDINVNEMTSEKQLEKHLKSIFNEIQLPNFLKNRILNDLKAILFYKNRTEETITIINNINRNNITNSSKLLNSQLEKIKQNQSFILQGINYKLQLIYIYILVNNLNLKNKFWHKFMNFLLVNEMFIKYYFDQQFNHSQLFQEFMNMNEENIKQKLENFFLVFETNLNNIENDIYNIIASFYFLIFYQFKGSSVPNIGNSYLNLTLKNFVIYLDKKFKNKIQFSDNLYELLKELYISDMNILVYNKYYPERNILYNFQNIDSVLIKNDKVKDAYNELKANYTSEKENEGFFTKVKNQLHLGEGRDFSTFEKYIKLIPCDEFVFTNTITIIIDGFTTEESNPMEKWKDFISYFNKESMFYFYKWPSDSVDNILARGILNALRFGSKNFSSACVRAKICGKILAYIIYSNDILKNYQINLVGFSLGNHVIKYCLKEINRLNELQKLNQNQYYIQQMNNNDPTFNEVYLKNVILIAAATTIKHKESMIKYARDIISNKLINCYSKVDKILEHLYYRCMFNEAVGRNELNLFIDNKNLVENYDFTPYNYGHLNYNMGVVAKVFSGNYKEI